jgi:serine/threonine protein kinase
MSCVEIIFLKGLFIDKVKDRNNFWGFSLHHDSIGFRRRMLFHKDEATIDAWIHELKKHAHFYNVADFYTQSVKLGAGKFSEVFQAQSKKSNISYALKRIDKTKLNQKEKEFLRDEI